MDQALKSFVVKFSIVLGTLVVLGAMILGTRSYSEYLKEQNHLQAQSTIRAMVAFCDFSKMSDDEQSAIDRCGDDVKAVRFKLKQTIDDRIIFWKGRINDVVEKMHKVEGIKRDANFWSESNERTFREVLGKLATEGKQAVGQYDSWVKRQKDLVDWKPGKKDSKTLIDPSPRKSESGNL